MFKYKIIQLWIAFAAIYCSPCFGYSESKGDKPTSGKNMLNTRVFTSGSNWLKLEFSSDSLLHFEFGSGTPPSTDTEIYRTPLFNESVFSGSPTFKELNPTLFRTSEFFVQIKNLCFEVRTRQSARLVGNYCADGFSKKWKTLHVATENLTHVYGLGETFDEEGKIFANRLGRKTETAGDYGNIMKSFAGGAVAEALFPISYALGAGDETFILALDNIYKQVWDLQNSKWQIGMFGDKVAGFVGVQKNPLEARKMMMNVLGHSKLPPKKMFGYWMSEYGYDDWAEIDSRLDSMRKDQFPIDGFFLDLQWFGNVTAGSDYTAMGKLRFDESKFPNPKQKIENYRQKGIGLIAIEESYIGKALPEFQTFGEKGYLAHNCSSPNSPSYLTGEVTGNSSEWWGRGGMLDWSNKEGAAFWHDSKRQPLINLGLIGHWLDLGEPEMFDAKSCYFGSGESGKIEHQDVHNLFSFFWAKSLYAGYQRNHVTQRPYSILRSGNLGMQKYGATLWSGDIAGNLESYALHLASHAQLSWSGMDYYSSDIGGFHRNRVDGDPLSEFETKENFTLWFANATWFDVPVRSHVMNLENSKITAPNRIGHVESNKFNLIERYKLIPYYYSQAWRAWKDGSPFIAPISMIFASDQNLRDIVDERMIGNLMVGSATVARNYEKDIIFPEGLWYDYRNGESFRSDGLEKNKLSGYPLYRNGLYQVPVFAKSGALIVKSLESDIIKSRGLNEQPLKTNQELSVFIDEEGASSSFEYYEDDGVSSAYEAGQARITKISQQTVNLSTRLQIAASQGYFIQDQAQRQWIVPFYAPLGWSANKVIVAGQTLSLCNESRWRDGIWADGSCYRSSKLNEGAKIEVILSLESLIKPQEVEVEWSEGGNLTSSAQFVCKDNDSTQRNYGMYVTGSGERLGNWDVSKAIPLFTNGFLRGDWIGTISKLGNGETIEWKCIKIYPHSSTRRVEWQQGENNRFETTLSGGYQGATKGGFLRRFK